jgi:hypothetical protein
VDEREERGRTDRAQPLPVMWHHVVSRTLRARMAVVQMARSYALKPLFSIVAIGW